MELDRYLQDYPSDLNAVLNKIGILRRANKKGEAETYLSNVKDYNSEPPLDQMYLAFVYSDFGEEQKAISTLLTNSVESITAKRKYTLNIWGSFFWEKYRTPSTSLNW